MSVLLESIDLCIKYVNALLESVDLFSCLCMFFTAANKLYHKWANDYNIRPPESALDSVMPGDPCTNTYKLTSLSLDCSIRVYCNVALHCDCFIRVYRF